MPKTHPPYPAEYRRLMVEQARAGRSLKECAIAMRRMARTSAPGSKRWASRK